MKQILILLLLVLLPIVTADEGEIEIYKPRELFDLSVHVSNKTGDVLGATCQVEIRNETLNVIHNASFNEIGGGWYNSTFNTSKTGKYFCRQNCTQGKLFVSDTCDFIIKGDRQMPVAVIITVVSIIIIYFFILAKLITERQFTEHGMVKLMFYLIAFWVVLLPLNMALQFNVDNGGPQVVTDNLNLLHQIIVWLNYFITIYFVLWFLVQMLKKVLFLRGNHKLSSEK